MGHGVWESITEWVDTLSMASFYMKDQKALS